VEVASIINTIINDEFIVIPGTVLVEISVTDIESQSDVRVQLVDRCDVVAMYSRGANVFP